MPAFVVRQRVVADAVKAVTAELDHVAEAVRTHRNLLLRAEPAYLVIETVDVLPHLARNAIPDGARILPDAIDAVHDRARILGMERQEIENVLRCSLAIEF